MISEMMMSHEYEAFVARGRFMHFMNRVREVSFNFIAQSGMKDPPFRERPDEAVGLDLPDEVVLLDDPDTIRVKRKDITSSSQELKNVALLKIGNTAETEKCLDGGSFIEVQCMGISSDDDFVPGDQLFPAATSTSGTKKKNYKPSGRKKNEGAKRQLSFTPRVSKGLLADNEKHKAEIKKLGSESKPLKRKKNVTLTAEKEAVEVQLEQVQFFNPELQHDLEPSSNNVCAVQPLNQISETEIASKYEQLSQQLMHWIEESCSSIEGGLEEHLVVETKTQLVLPSPEVVRARELLSQFPDGAELVIQHEIFKILRTKVLMSDGFLAALPPLFSKFLGVIEHGMTVGKPNQDVQAVLNWRSVTLNALLASPNFQPFISKKGVQVTKYIYQHLFQVLPALLNPQDSFEELKDDVVIPAIKFAHLIEALPMKYGFGELFCSSPVEMQKMVPFSWLEKRVLKDVVTRRILKAGNAVRTDESGFIGQLIMDSEPTLERVTHGQAQNVQIRRAVAAVKLIAPVRKQTKRPRIA